MNELYEEYVSQMSLNSRTQYQTQCAPRTCLFKMDHFCDYRRRDRRSVWYGVLFCIIISHRFTHTEYLADLPVAARRSWNCCNVPLFA